MERLTGLIDTLYKWFESINPLWLIFFLLCLNNLCFHPFTDEEAYFLWAKQYMNQDWMPHSFTIAYWEGATARLIYFWIAGTFLKFLSFEWLTFIGRLTLTLGMVFPLSKIYQHLKLKNLDITLALIFFLFIKKQNLLPGGGYIGGFVAKQIAAVFILFALQFFLEKKYRLTTVLIAIGTWFHIIVGGWFMLAVGIYLVISTPLNLKNWTQDILIPSAIYLALTIPYILFILLNGQSDLIPEMNGVNGNWIYVYFRHGPNLFPFFSSEIFWDKWFFGFLVYTVAFIILGLVFRREGSDSVRSINRLMMIMIAFLLLSLVISVFDENGLFLKFYPFRQGAWVKFLLAIHFVLVIKKYPRVEYLYKKYLKGIFVLILVYILMYPIKDFIKYFNSDFGWKVNELATYASQNTNPQDVFMFLGHDIDESDDYSSLYFIRKAERERFAVFKFTKSGSNQIYEWYFRLMEKQKVREDINHLFELKTRYRIDYLVIREPVSHPRLREVFSDSEYYLYLVE